MHHASSKDIMRPGAGKVPREPPNLSKTLSRRSVPEEPGDYESPKAGWIGSRPGLEAAVPPEVPRRTVGAGPPSAGGGLLGRAVPWSVHLEACLPRPGRLSHEHADP
jgi:hypothetical protein